MLGATTTTGPTTAERVRSACMRAEGAALAIDGSDPVITSLHHLRPNGEMIIAVPTDSLHSAVTWQSSCAGTPAVLELTDHAPLALGTQPQSQGVQLDPGTSLRGYARLDAVNLWV